MPHRPDDWNARRVAMNNHQRSWHMFRDAYGDMMDFLRFDPGNLSFPSRSIQKMHWVVAYRDASMSTTHQLFSFGDRYQIRLLGMERPALRGQTLAQTKRVTFPGPDQEIIHAAWTPPLDAVDHPYQGVLIRAEGGHKEPAHLAYDEETQWLAHQGMGGAHTLFSFGSLFGTVRPLDDGALVSDACS